MAAHPRVVRHAPRLRPASRKPLPSLGPCGVARGSAVRETRDGVGRRGGRRDAHRRARPGRPAGPGAGPAGHRGRSRRPSSGSAPPPWSSTSATSWLGEPEWYLGRISISPALPLARAPGRADRSRATSGAPARASAPGASSCCWAARSCSCGASRTRSRWPTGATSRASSSRWPARSSSTGSPPSLLIGAVCARLAGRNWRDTAEWGTGPAIGGLVGAGLVFSALPGHVDQMTGAANVVPFLSLAVLLGYVALRSGSLLPGFLVHLTIDLAALAFFAGELPGGLRVLVDVGALARRGARSHARRSPPRPAPAGPARHRPAQQRARGRARRELIAGHRGAAASSSSRPPGPDLHDTGRGHPERPARIERRPRRRRADAQLEDALTTSRRSRRHPRRARSSCTTPATSTRSRSSPGPAAVTSIPTPSSHPVPTPPPPGPAAAASRRSTRSTRDEADAAFVVVRPPGHHATARAARASACSTTSPSPRPRWSRAGERVRRSSTGTCTTATAPRTSSGTIRACSTCRRTSPPRIPGTGRAEETGGAHAPGLTRQLPVAAGRDRRRGARRHRRGGGARRSIASRPTWVLVSAGFDAHRADPLADLAWSAGDYAVARRRACSSSRRRPGRTVAFLEGGYDLDALRASSAATVATLAGVRARRPRRRRVAVPGAP